MSLETKIRELSKANANEASPEIPKCAETKFEFPKVPTIGL